MSKVASNDNTQLTTNVKGREPKLKFDFPNLRIGIAEYNEGPTGCTVFHFLKGVRISCDIRGGSAGLIGANWSYADAICFTGGSDYGLEAITGVTAELLKMRDFPGGGKKIPVVSGAVIYDFSVRINSIYPDKKLGRKALASAVEGEFPLGRQGAGISATVGKCFKDENKEFGGQGGAYFELDDIKILVFSVVNSLGALIDEKGSIVRGHLDKITGKRVDVIKQIKEDLSKNKSEKSNNPNITQNTTITLVLTNVKWDHYILRQLGKQIHSSMASVIHPFHSMADGDALFIATTNDIEPESLTATKFGILASSVAKEAILSSFEKCNDDEQ